MKILCISDAWLPQVNGVVRTYQTLQRELAALGHELHVIGPGDFPLTVPLPGYAEIRLALWPGKKLAAKIAAYNPDALHLATEGPLGWAARRYCLQRGYAFTTCYHTRFPAYLAARLPPLLAERVRRWAAAVLQRFHAPAALVMVATASLERELQREGLTGPFHRFGRGVSLDLFRPGAKTEFRALRHPVALYVGRVAVEKSIGDFLDAPWHGSKVVVGDGPALAGLRRAYPGVTFCGLLTGERLAACYRSADVFAFPSRTDTFGLVMIEALASGLPVAACPVTGPADIIDQPVLGALDDNFSVALKRAMVAPGDAAARAAHVAATYSWPAAARQFLDGLRKKG